MNATGRVTELVAIKGEAFFHAFTKWIFLLQQKEKKQEKTNT